MKNTSRTCLFVLIGTFVCSILPAYGQAISRKPLSEGHLERLQDPPASIVPRQPQVSPQLVSPFGPFISYQVNVDSNHNNIIGDAANEPSICVDPNNPNRMTIGWRQFNSVSSNFRQAGWAFTSDGGITWTFPGVLQNNVFRSDPVLNSDSTGQFYYLSLLDNFFDDIWRSVDGGQSFTDLAPATGGDKEWFTIDKTNSSGHGFQYQAWSTAGNNYSGRQFSRSTDGGFSWIAPVNIPHSPIWGTLDVDSNGTLFIGGVNPTTGQFWCVRSSNAKNAAVTPTFDQSTLVDLGGGIVVNQSINQDGLVGQINLAVDRSGTGTNNNVYMLGSLQRNGFSSGSDILFVRSSDGGQTFSPPVRINDDPVNPNKWHWFGALAVAPNGRIDCVWLDTRNAANNTDSQLFYSYSINGGITWAPNVPVSNSFNPFLGYPNQNKLGDYITVVSDNNGANVAYSATFNGEEDVYYVRIPFPTPVVTATVPDRAVIGLVANANNLYVTAENAGNSPLIANRNALGSWERFRIEDQGNGYVALRSLVNNLFVCAENAGASPLIANRGAVGLWEQFQLVDAGGGNFSLIARVNGKYVCAENAGSSSLIANRDAIGSWEQFRLFVTLRAVINNKLVVAENAGNSPLIANRDAVGVWEQFQYIDAPTPGYFALKAKANGFYVCAENAGNSPLIANRGAIGTWEQFQWIAGGNGNIVIKALVNGLFVTAENAGNNPLIANRTAAGTWEQFQ